MKKQNGQLEKLRKLIKIELEACEEDLWPKVCEMQSTDKGYERLEEMIIRFVAEEAMPIGSAIAHIEQELSHQVSSS